MKNKYIHPTINTVLFRVCLLCRAAMMPILIIPSNQKSKIQRNISQCYGMFIHENASENVVRKIVAIFSRLQFPQSTLTRP